MKQQTYVVYDTNAKEFLTRTYAWSQNIEDAIFFDQLSDAQADMNEVLRDSRKELSIMNATITLGASAS